MSLKFDELVLQFSVALLVCELQTHLQLVVLGDILCECDIFLLDYFLDSLKFCFHSLVLLQVLLVGQCLLLLAYLQVVDLVLLLLVLLLQLCILL